MENYIENNFLLLEQLQYSGQSGPRSATCTRPKHAETRFVMVCLHCGPTNAKAVTRRP